MSGALEIRSGGLVAVDTAELRHAASVWQQLSVRCAEAAERIRRASAVGPVLIADYPSSTVAAAADDAAAIARDLRALALLYEIVELEAAHAAAAAAGDAPLASALAARLQALRVSHPTGAADAHALVAAWEQSRHAEVEAQLADAALPFAGLGWIAIPVGLQALGAVRTLGLGTVPAHARQQGPPLGVTVREQSRAGVSAPASLAEMTRRIPGDDVRVRVERYTMPDGSRQFAAYVPGTQTLRSRTDPFDMVSNVRLYTGQRADAQVAVATALRRAGAAPGDAVHLVGHSQGAMIGSRLALEGEFRVATLVTAGSPVHAEVGRETLHIALRHSDDPVAALTGGGTAHAAGAPGSFVAERVADPGGSVTDLALGMHHLEGYIETAQLVDASDDPRMGGIRGVLHELDTAETVERFDYAAARGVAAGPARGAPPLAH